MYSSYNIINSNIITLNKANPILNSITIQNGKITALNNPKSIFNSTFKTPGHVPLLLASNGLLSSRTGHTEMSLYLTHLANLSPITAICEMMDSETYSALSVDKAEKYAKENAIPFIDGKELLEFSKVN